MHTVSMPTATASSAGHAGPSTTQGGRGRRVIDAPMRAFHWLFALSFVGAYVTAETERWRLVHAVLGYTLAGLLVARLVYGFVGPRQARWSVLWGKLAPTGRWLVTLWREPQSAPWRQGQNLLMAWAVLGLLLIAVPVTASGYALFNDLGGEWLEDLHELAGNALLALVIGHLALIAALSLLRGQNQARPMLTGRTPGAGPDLVKQNRGWLAVALLVAVLAYWTWEWQNAPAPSSTAWAQGRGDNHGENGDDD